MDRSRADLLNKLNNLVSYLDTNYHEVTEAKAAKALLKAEECFAAIVIERRRK